MAIVEIDAIKALLDADQLVIAAGGGGIPVMEQGSRLKGASAIIEKDRAAGLLAKETDADVLMFLTGVDNVSLNYGTDHEVHLDKVTAADADRYAKEGQFSAGSMLPKIEASIDFINAGKGRHAIITSMDMAKDALAGRGGDHHRIVPEPEHIWKIWKGLYGSALYRSGDAAPLSALGIWIR